MAIPQPRPLPPANNLDAACHQVINQPQGYPATRFEQAIQGRTGQELVNVISRMINNHETVRYLEKEMREFPSLLTIEDYVYRNGQAWNFDQKTTNNAHDRAIYFDQLVAAQYGLGGFTRYI
jgi:hypothetical protein